MRDMTKAQFAKALEHYGFRHEAIGYYRIDGTGTSVYARNGGVSRRAQLAYLINEANRIALTAEDVARIAEAK